MQIKLNFFKYIVAMLVFCLSVCLNYNMCQAHVVALNGTNNVKDVSVVYFYDFDLSKETNQDKAQIIKEMKLNKLEENSVLSSNQKYKLKDILHRHNVKIEESYMQDFENKGCFAYSKEQVVPVQDMYGKLINYNNNSLVLELNFDNMDGNGYVTTLVPFCNKSNNSSLSFKKSFYLYYTDSLLISISKDKYLLVSPY